MVGGRDAVDKNRRASIVTVRVSCRGARHASSSARRLVPEWQVVYLRLLCQTDLHCELVGVDRNDVTPTVHSYLML